MRSDSLIDEGRPHISERIASHGALGFGAMSAPTVRDGLTFLSRYIQTRACYTQSSVITANDSIKVTLKMDEKVRPYIRRMSETLSMIFQSYIESAGASSAPTLWHFPFPEQENNVFYTRWLHGGYLFSASDLMLEVPGSVGMVVSKAESPILLVIPTGIPVEDGKKVNKWKKLFFFNDFQAYIKVMQEVFALLQCIPHHHHRVSCWHFLHKIRPSY